MTSTFHFAKTMQGISGLTPALYRRHQTNNLLYELCKPLAARVFGDGLCPVDDVYVASPEIYVFGVINLPERSKSFAIPRQHDVVHSFYALVTLAEGDTVENAFESFCIEIGGMVTERRSLAKTISMSKARSLWPIFTNRSPNFVYIPLLIAPLRVCSYQEMHITFNGICAHIEALVYEGVYVATDDSRRSLKLGDVDTTRYMGRNIVGCKNTVVERASNESTYVHTDRSKTVVVSMLHMRINAPATAIYTALHFQQAINVEEHPLVRAHLKIEGSVCYKFDHAMLEEINWQLCGLLPPTDAYKKKELRQDFLYLMPFSREAMANPPAAWICFNDFDTASLHLELKSDAYGEVQVVVSADVLNTRVYGNGMSYQNISNV